MDSMGKSRSAFQRIAPGIVDFKTTLAKTRKSLLFAENPFKN